MELEPEGPVSKRSVLAIGIVGVLLAGVLFVGYWRSRRPSTESSNITIGALLPLTGGAAPLGKPTLNGMQLAVEEYNNKRAPTEPQVNLVAEDDRAEPATGVSAFQKLRAVNNVRLILGPLTSGVTLAVAPLAERNQIVILSPGASAPNITSAGDFVFRNELSEASGAKAQAEFAVSRLNFDTVGLLYVNNEYGVGTVDVFRKRFMELGGRIVADEAFQTGETDFRTPLSKIASAKPDAMVIVYQDDIVGILRQRSQLGIAIPAYTTPIFEDPSNLKALGTLADGILYTYYGSFDPRGTLPSVAAFVTTYQQRFNEPPGYYAAQGYDAARILLTALTTVAFNQDQVKHSLYRIQKFPGVTGESSFDSNGDVVKPVSLKTVRGGQFVSY